MSEHGPQPERDLPAWHYEARVVDAMAAQDRKIVSLRRALEAIRDHEGHSHPVQVEDSMRRIARDALDG